MEFDIQLDERGRLKLPQSLREALTSSPEVSVHVSILGDTIVLRRSPKAPAPAAGTSPRHASPKRKRRAD